MMNVALFAVSLLGSRNVVPSRAEAGTGPLAQIRVVTVHYAQHHWERALLEATRGYPGGNVFPSRWERRIVCPLCARFFGFMGTFPVRMR